MEIPYKLVCLKCGRVWIRKGDRLPFKCPNPKCQSVDWNVKKVEKKKVEEK